MPLKKTICLGESTVLTAFGAGIDNFTWSGPNLSGTTGTPTFTGSALGTYTFNVSGTSACTSAAASTTVTVVAPPGKPSLGPDYTSCGPAVLAAPVAPGFRYLWSTGDTARVITVPPDTGVQPIILTLSNGGCERSDTINLRFQNQARPARPWVTSGNQPRCQGDSVLLAAPAAGYSQWLWSNGATTPSTWVRQTGWYKLRIGRADSCLSPWGDSLFVQFLPRARVSGLSGPSRICPGQQQVRYRLAALGHRIIWQVTGGTLLAADSLEATINWGASGSGNIRVIATTNNACPGDTLDFPVTINRLLTPLAPQGRPLVCDKSQAQLYEVPLPDQQPGASFVWNVTNGSLISQSGYQAWVRWNGSGTLSFTQTITADSVCTGTSPAIAVEVLEPVTLSYPATLCQGDSIRAMVTSPSSWNFRWTFGNNRITGNGLATLAADSGLQTLQLNYSYGGCFIDTAVGIVVYPRPAPALESGPRAVCPNEVSQSVYQFKGLAGSSWQYSVLGGNVLSTNKSQIWLSWNEGAPLHQITVTETSAQGCVSAPYILPVTITANPGLPASGCDPELFPLSIPNVITPNGDGYNDRLVINNLKYYGNCQLVLTSRWGQTVYSAASYTNDFDGGDLAAGVYFYQLLAGGRVYTGWLLVVR